MKKILFYSPLLIVILLGFFFYITLNGNKKIISSPLVGKKIHEFNISRLLESNDTFSTNDLINNKSIKFVNIWASWCIPCRVEHDVLKIISDIENVDLYGINYKDKKDNALNFIESLGNPFKEIGVDLNGRASIEWGVFGVPETFIVYDEKIIYKHIGPIHLSELEDKIIPMIKDLN